LRAGRRHPAGSFNRLDSCEQDARDPPTRMSALQLRQADSLSYNGRLDMKTPRFLLRGFRRPSEVASLALGKLEREVLEQTWQRGEVSVRDIFLAFEERIAYTTLMTTLDRLYKKHLLTRRKDGRAFLYEPAVTRDELDYGIREDVIDGLFSEGTDGIQPLLACIVDTVSERDRELLDELDRLVKEKKRELRRKSD